MTPWYLAELDDENGPNQFEFIAILFFILLLGLLWISR